MLDSYNLQVQGVYDNYCENCQQEGHRTWACPFQQKSHIVVRCQICQETSHPTSDCPLKQEHLKKVQSEQIAMLLESQYSQFKEDLNKPKGGTAFITDFERKDQLLAITHGRANPENNPPAPKPAALSMAPPPKPIDE